MALGAGRRDVLRQVLGQGARMALLCAVALAACYVPARRAMRLDPFAVLRHE